MNEDGFDREDWDTALAVLGGGPDDDLDNINLSGYEIGDDVPAGEAEGADEAFKGIAGHNRWGGDFMQAANRTEFCDSLARIAQGGFCYKRGQGLMRYEAPSGTWVEDIKESKLLDFLFNAADEYRGYWKNSEKLNDWPSIARLCRSLESPTFIRMEVQPAVRAMLTQKGTLFDSDPFSINCGGMAVNLRTGKQRRARKEDYFTRRTAFKPGNPDKAVRFRQFLLEICGEDESKAAWVLRWFCRAAVGQTLDCYVLNLEGGGGNGKSVIANLFKQIYGGYGVILAQELAIKGEGNCGEMARAMQGLEGARYAMLPACGRGSLRVSAIKRLSSGDPAQARANYQERVEFIPCASIVICSNVPLFLNETGEAIIRRWKTVRFEWSGQPDRLLPKKLALEGEAITGLIIREAGRYLEDIEAGGDGFPPCEAVDQWAKDYVEECDPVKQFLEEHPEMFKTPVLCKRAWEYYQNEAPSYGEKYPQLHIFREGMRAAGFTEKRLNPHKLRHWVFVKG
jgi:phage/plasmid-associated DNA primase